MKKEEFAEKLCYHLEHRIIEICRKFAKGNVNNASLPAFWIGLSSNIKYFLEENNLIIIRR